jgi:hypothetical protein
VEDETPIAEEKVETVAVDQDYAELLERPIVHPDIVNVLRPLTTAEYETLEESLKREGCRDPVVIWKEMGILLAGHNRHEICTRRDMPLRKILISLPDFSAAVEWVIKDQLARRNLTPIERCLLALKLEPAIAARAKAHQRASGGAVPSKLKEPPIDTLAEVAKIAGVSVGNLSKVKKIEEGATEDVKRRVRNGDLTINAASKRVWALGPDSPARKSAIERMRERMGSSGESMQLTELKANLERFRAFVRKCDGLTREDRQAFISEVASLLAEMQTMWLGHREDPANTEGGN